METTDPREGYVSNISLEKSSIQLDPPIVFLFGGEVGDIKSPATSIRRCLLDYISTNDPHLFERLVVPEEFEDWLHDSAYPDLLTFESDLAQTSALVVIALESPGAIAELGSFSVNLALKKKTVVIISDFHFRQKSFIRLGPMRQILENNIYAYPYDHNNPVGSIDDYLEDIVRNIKLNIDSSNSSEAFDRENNGHIAMLIYELVSIFKAITFNEIKSYLKIMLVNANTTIIKRLIFLLAKLDLVVCKRMGKIDYYLPLKTEERLTLSGFDKQRSFQRTSVIIGTASYYESSTKEKFRKLVISNSTGNVTCLPFLGPVDT